MKLTVAGIGTDVGKTVISAILCEAFSLEYWKPVQAGDLERSDSDVVNELTTSSKIWPEQFKLTEAMSPHAAADIDDVAIKLSSFEPPKSKHLLVELAGGLMVPLNERDLTIDLAKQLGFPIVLVANYYLGSINHTLLTIELLKGSGLPVVGVIFNGLANTASRAAILGYSEIELLADVAVASPLTPEFVRSHAAALREHPRLAQFRS